MPLGATAPGCGHDGVMKKRTQKKPPRRRRLPPERAEAYATLMLLHQVLVHFGSALDEATRLLERHGSALGKRRKGLLWNAVANHNHTLMKDSELFEHSCATFSQQGLPLRLPTVQ
jgi:hypothetical protein